MNCDRIARIYRWLEYAAFGRLLQSHRTRFIDEVADARRVLMVGEGDGRFLCRFAERNSGASIDCLDASAAMLRLAKSALPGDGAGDMQRMRFIHARVGGAALGGGPYDLIVTHFFLDCFDAEELSRWMPEVAGAAAPGARWLVSDFGYPPARFARLMARGALAIIYAFFRVTTGLRNRAIPDYGPILERCGFRRRVRDESLGGFLFSEIWSREGRAAQKL